MGHHLAAVRPDHTADGQTNAGRGGSLPHARHAAHVRSAIRHDRPRQVPVETLSIFSYQEATQNRYGPAAAYAIILFIYVLLVAFLFVRILGPM